MAGVRVHIDSLTKKFGSVIAVDSLTLDVQPGELFTLLGPSGCGKTTLLRTIAGFYYQDQGTISVDSLRIDNVPAHQRDMGMVFQSYAVFPFLNVFDNIAYGLKVRKLPRSEIRERVMKVLDLVRLTGMEHRRPDQLSGGQQQRVAVARAIVIEPRVLLMDEPLSNLDAKLRVGMRVDLKLLQKKLGITMIYVTHDQEEALAISDRIAVMANGHISQVGTPWEIYQSPESPYVANFVGVTNFFRCRLVSRTPLGAKLLFEGREIEVPLICEPSCQEVVLSVRPEALKAASGSTASSSDTVSLHGRVVDTIYLGSFLRIVADTESGVRFQAEVSNPNVGDLIEAGTQIDFIFSKSDISVFTGQTPDD